jgi:ubiquinone/menaquinone biosynthesis C-methylase UbiE
MERIYRDLWAAGEIERWLASQASLQPRGPASLFDLIAEIGLSSTSRVIDVGCGEGNYTCELVKRFGCYVVALDPIESNLEETRCRVQTEGLTARVTVQKGQMETLPFADGEFSLVWCRGVIVHLPALAPALVECRRVLTPGGLMMLQTGFATARLEPNEADALCRRLGFFWNSLQRDQVEAAIEGAGFRILRSDVMSSELAEFYEAQDGRCAKYLMGIAKLLRAEDHCVRQFGRDVYETTLGMYYWQIYQMLGKISYHAYLLEASL